MGRLRECKGDRAVSTTAWTEGENTNIEIGKKLKQKQTVWSTKKPRHVVKGEEREIEAKDKAQTCAI